MPRQVRLRKIVAPPRFKSYKPMGANVKENEPIELLYEEYEALKLADYENLNHIDACKLMGISRPTFARIYASARKKIARAFVEVREIKTVYGNSKFDKSWYQCNDCEAKFSIPQTVDTKQCPLCRSRNTILTTKANTQ